MRIQLGIIPGRQKTLQGHHSTVEQITLVSQKYSIFKVMELRLFLIIITF